MVAEYIGVAVNMAMGRPLYLIVNDPANGPLVEEAVTQAVDGAARRTGGRPAVPARESGTSR